MAGRVARSDRRNKSRGLRQVLARASTRDTNPSRGEITVNHVNQYSLKTTFAQKLKRERP